MPQLTYITDEHRKFATASLGLLQHKLNRQIYESYAATLQKRFEDMWKCTSTRSRFVSLILLFWLRSPRGGIGCRSSFNNILRWLAENDQNAKKWILQGLHLIPEYGRWDDLCVLFGTSIEKEAATFWADAIRNKNSLACKWAKNDMKPLQKALKCNVVELRRLLVSGRKDILETYMCQRRWSEIPYDKLSPHQIKVNFNAFQRHDAQRFQFFLNQRRKITIDTPKVLPQAGNHGWVKKLELYLHEKYKEHQDSYEILRKLLEPDEIQALGLPVAAEVSNEIVETSDAFTAKAEWDYLVRLPSNNKVGSWSKLASALNTVTTRKQIADYFGYRDWDQIAHFIRLYQNKPKVVQYGDLQHFLKKALCKLLSLPLE